MRPAPLHFPLSAVFHVHAGTCYSLRPSDVPHKRPVSAPRRKSLSHRAMSKRRFLSPFPAVASQLPRRQFAQVLLERRSLPREGLRDSFGSNRLSCTPL